MAVSAAILTRVPAAFLPLKPSLNSNRTNRKNRTKSEEKPPKQAVFLRKVVRVTGFEPAASCSQSRRATNCATPGYEVVGWPGRILPKQARYQLRYTRIFNLLHDSTRGKKNQAITAIKCSNIFDDFFLYLEYNTATTSKALEEFSLEKAERRH